MTHDEEYIFMQIRFKFKFFSFFLIYITPTCVRIVGLSKQIKKIMLLVNLY